MMTYADGFHSHSVIGISLVVGSASTAAMYKVRITNLADIIQAHVDCFTHDLNYTWSGCIYNYISHFRFCSSLFWVTQNSVKQLCISPSSVELIWSSLAPYPWSCFSRGLRTLSHLEICHGQVSVAWLLFFWVRGWIYEHTSHDLEWINIDRFHHFAYWDFFFFSLSVQLSLEFWCFDNTSYSDFSGCCPQCSCQCWWVVLAIMMIMMWWQRIKGTSWCPRRTIFGHMVPYRIFNINFQNFFVVDKDFNTMKKWFFTVWHHCEAELL